MSSPLLRGLTEVISFTTSGVYWTPSYQITYGLDGDDRFGALSGSTQNVMVGGPGNDTYSTAWHSAVTIVDTGGYDALYADGLDIYSPYTYAMTLEGRHFVAFDTLWQETVIIADAYFPDTRIEEIHLSSGSYEFSELQALLPQMPNYLGDIPVEQAIEYGLLPAGTSSQDLEAAFDEIVAREAALLLKYPSVMPEFREAIRGVDTTYYLETNPDVAAAGVNPWFHYFSHGWKEGRDPNVLFDTSWYLQRNPDVAAAGVNPLAHYFSHGVPEGRDPSPLFDSDWYLRQNEDVGAAGVNPLEHYRWNGWLETRDPNPLFDTDWYLATNADVASANVEPLAHYMSHGWREGRDPSPGFDASGYLERNPDVALAGVDPLAHYLQWGMLEGREI